jgi:tetratricopeptide (TPR) repeat protein
MIMYRQSMMENFYYMQGPLSTQSHELPSFTEVMADYTKCLQLDPNFYYAYFNRGNIKILNKDYIGAIWDFSRAISIEPKFAEGYYNRGLTYIYIQKTEEGCSDMSKAGELGVEKAYSVIKKYCK